MKNKLFLFIMFLLGYQSIIAQADLSFFFSDVDAFLKKQVQYNKVKYQDIKYKPKNINKLVSFIAKTDVSKNTAIEQKAYFINVYNLLVIKAVVDNYPLKNPLEIEGFFDEIKYTIGNRKYSLNQLEKEILLETYKDPRLHFVLVCAAISCSPIANFAYTPDKLEQQLNNRTKEALNNAVFIQYNDYDKKVDISEVFKWYSNDFQPNVREYINQYREVKLPQNIELGYYPYNWSINDLPTKKKK